MCLAGISQRRLALFDMPNLNRFDILSISIFCKIALSISIFSKITISISISISIFLELPYRYRYRYRYFSELPYRYRYRYRYFSKVSIYRQSICHIDISNRASGQWIFRGALTNIGGHSLANLWGGAISRSNTNANTNTTHSTLQSDIQI